VTIKLPVRKGQRKNTDRTSYLQFIPLYCRRLRL